MRAQSPAGRCVAWVRFGGGPGYLSWPKLAADLGAFALACTDVLLLITEVVALRRLEQEDMVMGVHQKVKRWQYSQCNVVSGCKSSLVDDSGYICQTCSYIYWRRGQGRGGNPRRSRDTLDNTGVQFSPPTSPTP